MDGAEMPQSDEYYTVPIKFVDLTGATGDGQTEFKCELFFNDSVYEYCCEGCGKDIKSGMEDTESGVAYCLECVGEMLRKGHAKIVKRAPCDVCGDRALDFRCVGCGR